MNFCQRKDIAIIVDNSMHFPIPVNRDEFPATDGDNVDSHVFVNAMFDALQNDIAHLENSFVLEQIFLTGGSGGSLPIREVCITTKTNSALTDSYSSKY